MSIKLWKSKFAIEQANVIQSALREFMILTYLSQLLNGIAEDPQRLLICVTKLYLTLYCDSGCTGKVAIIQRRELLPVWSGAVQFPIPVTG